MGDKSNPATGDGTSGNNETLWMMTSKPLIYEPLERSVNTDVLVIGGGIAGVTTAYCLAKSGKNVVLVEDGYLGSGETGRTTAHLTWLLDERFTDLEAIFGPERTRMIAESHKAAIDWIRETVKEEKIRCHLKDIDGYLFLHPSDELENLEKEFDLMRRLELPARWLDSVPQLTGGGRMPCIHLPDQAQFHVLLFIRGLAEAIIRMGGKIFTESHATRITDTGAEVNGHEVSAAHVVVATNTAVNDMVTMHTKQWPYRSYVVAAKIPQGSLDAAFWWDTGDQHSEWLEYPYNYARTEEGKDGYDYLMIGGQDHRTGQEERDEISYEERYRRLEHWGRKHFPEMGEVVAHWSGQIMYSLDGLGYSGRNPGDDNIYIITGDSGNGMTNSVIGAQIIEALIHDREHEWSELYSPSRIVLRKAGDYLHEVANMVGQYADWFTPGDQTTIEELKPGEGAVIREGLKKLAVYRDENDKLHTCSAVCPHLGAILQWNSDEKTFDCPMHGSRFTGEGKVVNGPANEGLKPLEKKDDQSSVPEGS